MCFPRGEGRDHRDKKGKGKRLSGNFEPVPTLHPERAHARTHEPKPKSISRLDSPPNLRYRLSGRNVACTLHTFDSSTDNCDLRNPYMTLQRGSAVKNTKFQYRHGLFCAHLNSNIPSHNGPILNFVCIPNSDLYAFQSTSLPSGLRSRFYDM